MFWVWCRFFSNKHFEVNIYIFYLCRDCVRERNERRSSPSVAVPNTAVGLRAPCKQVLLVSHSGEGVTLLFLISFFPCWLFRKSCFVVDFVSNVLCIAVFPGCCRYRTIIRREVCTLPASQNVCQQQQQPPDYIHTDAGSKSEDI